MIRVLPGRSEQQVWTFDECDEDVEQGIRFTKNVKDPLMPSKQEVDEHQLTHLPYRNWCRHCVRGRGKQTPHQASKGSTGLPEISFDFCFVGEEGEPVKTVAILCARDRHTKMLMASVTPTKSSTGSGKPLQRVTSRVQESLRQLEKGGPSEVSRLSSRSR